MRVILLAVALTVLLPCSVSAQGAKQRAATEQELRRLDLAHADAVLRGGLAAMDKLRTEDFKVNNHAVEVGHRATMKTKSKAFIFESVRLPGTRSRKTSAP